MSDEQPEPCCRGLSPKECGETPNADCQRERELIEFDDLRQGDFVKVRIGNERLWFNVLSFVDNPANAVLCTLVSSSICGARFDGRVTLDRSQIIDAARDKKPNLRIV